MYCITHELDNVENFGEECIAASCPPPEEYDKDGWEFIMGLSVPSPEELEQMDETARELELELS